MDTNKAIGAQVNAAGSEQPADRDKVKSEREARRLAKLAAKQNKGSKSVASSFPTSTTSNTADGISVDKSNKVDQQAKKCVTDAMNNLSISKAEQKPSSASTLPEKKQLSKAERRAIQEAQRAAKADKQPVPSKSTAAAVSNEVNKTKKTLEKPIAKTDELKEVSTARKPVTKRSIEHRVKLFNHLYTNNLPCEVLNSSEIHPAIVQLGVQYSNRIVKGCNARGLAFMNAMKSVIEDYETPSQKEFSRGLEDTIKLCANYLQKCRPLAVSMTNAMKSIQYQLRQLQTSETEAEQKHVLLDHINTYVRDQMDKAAEAISITVQQKISDGDVILTFGCSSVILNILNEAKKSKRRFRVIVVDARPWHEGNEMLRRLVSKNIQCTCVLINAVGFIMPEVTKVLLGAHALLANGYVMSRVGTAQIALIAKSYNVPVLVCCETHKFSERVQTDAFVFNEIGDPYDLVTNNVSSESPLANWETLPSLTPLNLYYDVTPSELVSAVVTEVAILPCTSVPVILRIKPSDTY